LERGERHPHTPTLHKIAKGYGVPVEDLLVEPVLVGKAEAPEAGLPAQERREQLRNIRKWLVDAHEILEGSFKGYRTAGDGRRLVGLTSLAVLSAIGAERLAVDMVGPPGEDLESVRVYSAVARFDDLVEDIVEELGLLSEDDAQEEGVGAVVESLSNFRLRKDAS
jgi:hypothetical protein